MNVESADRKMNEAITYYNMKRYEQADKAIREVLYENPQDVFAQLMLAKCCYMLDRYDEAEQLCKEVVPTYLSAEAYCLLGKTARETKRYREAEGFFLKSLEEDPQDAATLAEYAYLLLICGYFKKADDVMKEALRIAPEDSLVLHYKYYFDHAVGGKKKEREAVTRFIESSSNEVNNLTKIGLTEYKNNRFKSAREYFRQAFLLEPTNEYILEMLEELDRINHFIFFPNRIFSMINPVIRFILVPVITLAIFILLSIFAGTAAVVFLTAFLVCLMLFTAWSWLSHPIYRILIRKKK